MQIGTCVQPTPDFTLASIGTAETHDFIAGSGSSSHGMDLHPVNAINTRLKLASSLISLYIVTDKPVVRVGIVLTVPYRAEGFNIVWVFRPFKAALPIL